MNSADDPRFSFPIPFWYEWSPWEPTVQLAFNDLVRPGDVVFDVGANAGGLTVLLSRLAGPKGTVCAFEASPRIIDKCQHNLAVNGCTNVHLIHRAVHRTSNEIVNVYAGTTLNDSLLPVHTTGVVVGQVRTLALDDFIAHFDLAPNLVKMDIRGGEFEALMGMTALIASKRPHLILEQHPSDMRCHETLTQSGYLALDLATYAQIRHSSDYPPRTQVANVLFIHSSRLGETGYQIPVTTTEVRRLHERDFRRVAEGSYALQEPIQLARGRYIAVVDVLAERQDNELMAGVQLSGREVFRYHTSSHFLSTSYRHWVFQTDRTAVADLFLRFVSGISDPTLRILGASILRVDQIEVSDPPIAL
jgi:FkbM family methyltransferase